MGLLSRFVTLNMLTFLFVLLPVLTIGTKESDNEQEILKHLLDKKLYDKRSRALSAYSGAPTTVYVNLFVRSFERLSDVNMDYSVQITFRMQWIDKRLAYVSTASSGTSADYLTLAHDQHSEIWIPDIFFSNEKRYHEHDLIQPNKFIRISPDGSVLYSSRLTLTLSCPMILKLYPFDTQTCGMRLSSYASTNDDIKLVWKERDPVQVTQEIHLPHFSLKEFRTDYCDSHTNTGVYSCLNLLFQFRRESHFFLIQVFAPSCMLILLGWLSFWLDFKTGLNRLIMTLVPLLLYAAWTVFLNEKTPAVSYTTAMDLWTGSCLTFLFFAVVEYVLVNYLGRKKDEEENENHASYKALEVGDSWTLSGTIDALSRVLYPVAFVIFSVLYFYAYEFIREASCKHGQNPGTVCVSE